MVLADLRAILATAIIAIASFGGGHWTRKFLPSSMTELGRVIVSWICGIGILSLSLFLAGQFIFTAKSISIVILGFAFAALRPLTHLAKSARAYKKENLKFAMAPAVIIAFVLLLTAVAGLAEITGDWGNDAVVYHLLGPKVWLREGVVRPVSDNCHTAFPAIAEIMYGALMALGGKLAPGFSAVLTLCFLLLIVFLLARRLGLTAVHSAWAVALVAAMPAVYIGGHSTFVDALYATFVLAAAVVGFDARTWGQFALFGLLCGLAMATKYTGLLAMPVLILCAAVRAVISGDREGKRLLGKLGSAAGVAGLIACPYYLRNWILLGSPIYPPPPVLFHFFRIRYLSEDAVRIFYDYLYVRGAGMGRGFKAFFLLPFNLTYHTANFHGAGGIGLTALALAPFGLIALRRDAFSRALALLGLLLTVAWFLTQQESRFLIHVYVIAAIFGVAGWRHAVAQAPRCARALCGMVIVISISYGLYMIAESRKNEVHAAVSPAFAAEWRQKTIPFLESMEFVNGNSSVEKILILDRTVLPYYLDRNYLKARGQWGEETLPGDPDVHQILRQARDLGISHVLDVHSAVAPFQVPGDMPGLKLVFERQDQRIYQVE